MLTEEEFLRFFPFHWECKCCHKKSTFRGEQFSLENVLNEDFSKIADDDSLDYVTSFEDIEKAKSAIKYITYETTATYCTVNCKCLNCLTNINISAWVEVSKEKLSDTEYRIEIVDLSITDGDLDLICEPGLYRGTDIATGLNQLYLRWFYLSGDITVVCPFIESNSVDYFESIGQQILKTYSFIHGGESNTNPFKRIITRDNLWNIDLKRPIGIEKRILSFIENNSNYIYQDHLSSILIPDRSLGAGLCKIIKNNLFGINLRIERNQKLKDHHYYRGYFHGKLYGASFGKTSEIVVTSYNYVSVETLQFESVSLHFSTPEKLEFQVEKMFHDKQLEISLIDDFLSKYTVL